MTWRLCGGLAGGLGRAVGSATCRPLHLGIYSLHFQLTVFLRIGAYLELRLFKRGVASSVSTCSLITFVSICCCLLLCGGCYSDCCGCCCGCCSCCCCCGWLHHGGKAVVEAAGKIATLHRAVGLRGICAAVGTIGAAADVVHMHLLYQLTVVIRAT